MKLLAYAEDVQQCSVSHLRRCAALTVRDCTVVVFVQAWPALGPPTPTVQTSSVSSFMCVVYHV